jgi:CyaY protein
MIEEQQYRHLAENALEALKKHLYVREESNEDFEVDEQGGVLQILFDDPAEKFVITSNSAVRQIWISALSTSFKLDWSPEANDFVLPKTGERLEPLLDRLIDSKQAG